MEQGSAMITLHDHQNEAVEEVRARMMQGHKSVLLQSPTGSGKSIMAGSLVAKTIEKGNSAALIVPRRELIRQMDETFELFKIKHSFVANGYSFNPYQKMHVCSSGTLVNRLGNIKPKVVLIDETHYGGNQLDKIIRYYKSIGSYIIGLSATPWRLDGRGLGMWYSSMVHGKSIKWLIDNEFLSDFRLFGVSNPNLSGIKTVAGDYAKGELAAKMEADNVVVGDVVNHYRDHAMGKLGVTYSTSRKHSEIIVQKFRDAGIPAASIDGTTPENERRQLIRAFARRELLQLVNCELLIFGFDLALAAGMDVAIECMSDVQPTQSLSKQLQKWGRVLRWKKEPALIFDHASNWSRHGYPDDERDWSLSGQPKEERNNSESAVAAKQCTSCFFVHPPAPACPNCGHVYPIRSREVDEVDGSLSELTRNANRPIVDPVAMQEAIDKMTANAMSRGIPREQAMIWAAKKYTKQQNAR